ncbi:MULTISPECIES: TatD family hydrolase [Metallosphaera]|uniref:TatD family hydrolase n=1 Tax=Metallosphaera TaxID=41980 RepID=UPI001F051D0F|nr:TatD family hydrolase [Metallosphaera sedula]MCH1770697.1 TatD family hydrolase [Metallosphaera sedula]MCP6728895.1 TatD family hydrolase [Metallosphaera sedula]
MLLDAHAHVDVREFDSDRDLVLSRCDILVVNAGVDLATDLATLELARRYRNVVPAVGFHPEFIEKVDQELEQVRKLVELAPIISEVGLDYFWIKDEELRKKQKQVLEVFMELGQAQDKPLIIHSRGGLREILDLVSSYRVRFAIHGYEGSMRDASRIVELGGFLSFPPIIVRDKGRREIARVVHEDHILTETDSPFMGPDRSRNEPCNVRITVNTLAEIRKMGKDELEEKIMNNFRRLLGPHFSSLGANLTKR